MPDYVKFIGSEITLSSANTVANSAVIRLTNTDSSNSVVITQKSNSTTTVAIFTLNKAGSDESTVYLIKGPTHTLEISSGTAVVKAVPVAYR